MKYLGINKLRVMKNLNINTFTIITTIVGIICMAFDLMPGMWAGVVSGVFVFNLMQNNKEVIDKKLKLVYNRFKRF